MSRLLVAPLLVALVGSAAAADEPARFSLSGFGTLGVVRSDKDDFHFRSSTTQSSSSPGQNFDATTDSVLGVQGTARIHDQLDATVQAVTRHTAGYDYAPRISWAYLRYRATPELTLRAGRTTTPFFMFSDSHNLNYITPWVRPPVEVYSLNPFSALDGIDLLYRFPIGAFDLEIQALYGDSNVSIPWGSRISLKGAKGLKLAIAGSGLTFQAGYARTDLHVHWNDSFYQHLVTTLPPNVAQNMSGDEGHAQFFSAGLQWEKDNWLVITEYAKRKVDRYINTSHAWYITAGYRFGELTPFFTYAQQTQDTPANDVTLPPAQAPLMNIFNASRNNAQKSVALGMRLDVARNVALKGQLERIYPGPDGRGIFAPPDTPADYIKTTDPVHVLSLSVDFVF